MTYKNVADKRRANREWMRDHPEVNKRAAKKKRGRLATDPVAKAAHQAERREDAARWRATGGRRACEDRARSLDPKRVWLRQMLGSAKWRAKRKGVHFLLTLADVRSLALPDTCPYLGIPLIYTGSGRGKTGPHENSPSIDRIRPAMGYVRGNIEIISNRANALKGNGTSDEHQKIADRLRKLERLYATHPLLAG